MLQLPITRYGACRYRGLLVCCHYVLSMMSVSCLSASFSRQHFNVEVVYWLLGVLFTFPLLLLLLLLPLRTACAACPSDWKPYCIATSQFGPRTYANCCFAKCNGVNILKHVLHPGGCKDSCKQCDQSRESPVCCGGRTYRNGCYATCNREDMANCRSGRCSSGGGG